MQLSFWEQDTFFSRLDVVIAGSGIVGLNAALNLKKQAPQLRILVIERGILPSGASTRNAGFACFGSCTELLDDMRTASENDVFSLVERRYRGLERLRANLGDAAIAYENLGGYELIDKDDVFQQCESVIPHFNKLLKPVTGLDETYVNASNRIAPFGFGNVKHLVQNRAEGQIDTGRMMAALLHKTMAAGIRIINGLGVTGFTAEENGVTIHTDQDFSIRSRRLLVCTNGFAKQLLPGYDVEPARAQVLITKPIENLRFSGTFHYEKGYYYFRNVGNRVLFGGGRNLNFEGERTMEMALTPQIQDKLEELLREVILPGTPFEIEQRWSGIMGVGNRKSTIIKPVADHVFCAVRMGGMGVAIGSLVGEEAAEMVVQSL